MEKLSVEARELYCYTTCSEPWASAIETSHCYSGVMALIKSASSAYANDYCTDKKECFSEEDKINVCKRICEERGIAYREE